MAGKYGIPYFTNYINSDMNPEDARSMCPLDGNEKVLVKSTRGRGLEYSKIKNIYEGNSQQQEREIYSDGDLVKGSFNKFENQEKLEITLGNNHKVIMTKSHLNYIIKEKFGEQKELIGEELKEGYYLPYSLNEFEGEGGNYDLGYFIGAYAGDGSFDRDTSVVFSLCKDDKENTLTKLQEIANDYFGAKTTVTEYDDTKLVTLKVHSKGAVGLCKDFVANKKRDKHYKANLYQMSKEFRKGVISGHYDTDGGNRNRIYTSSEKMVESLNMLTATLGTTTSIYEDDRYKDKTLSDNTNYSVLIYQLTNNSYSDLWFKKDNKLWMQIEKIEEVDGDVGYCFEVKNDKPTFTIGTTGILTHNCRLRLDKRELRKRGGGLFGSGEKTGSLGVVTLNLPRYAFLASNKEELFTQIDKYMRQAKDSLETKREFLNKYVLGTGLIEAFDEYVGTLKNHFSTIGLVGMNEMCENLIGKGIDTKEGHSLSLEVLDFMRERCKDFQEDTGNLYNLEATPAESTAYKLAKQDIAKYGQNINTREGDNSAPYYTNSCHLPVDEVKNIDHLIRHQSDLQKKFTGGTVVHAYLDNGITGDKAKHIIRQSFENSEVPYMSLSPVHSICLEHGYIDKYVKKCPKCDQEISTYQRVTGYIRQVEHFNPGKKAEFFDRNQLDGVNYAG